MSNAACPRAFEAEALRDSRLTGAERASFERHLDTCAACSGEMAALEALAASLHRDAGVIDEMRERRERVRLLAAFDGVLVNPKRTSRSTPIVLTAGIAAGLCLGGWAIQKFARTTPARIAAVSVHAEGASTWSERAQGNEDRVTLERGSLRIHVDHALPSTHLVVAVPDGEIEDIGTTFVVNVSEGRTERVAVEEGRVLVRLRGLPAHTVQAGEAWVPDDAATAVPRTAPPVPPVPPTSPLAQAPNPSASAPGIAIHVAPLDATLGFRAAMAALGRGDNRQAEQMLAVFLRNHAHDPHAEDAAYSRVVALQRCGDIAEMRRAAEQYLARYPAGFRREEVAALAH